MVMTSVRNGSGEMDTGTIDQINKGLENGKEVVTFLSTLRDPKTSKVFGNLFFFCQHLKVWLNPALS